MLNFLINLSTKAVYKGSALIIVGLLALLFVAWVKKKGEPLKGGFLVFILLALFVLCYGIFLVITQPNWWALPY